MKICYIADAASPHSLRWISYFAAKGHQIDWISTSEPEGILPPNIGFHLIKNSKFKSLKIIANAWAVRQLVKKIKPDILHAHYAGVNGVLAWIAGFHPLVITAWGSDISVAAQKPVMRILIAPALKGADLVTCDAFHLKDAIIRLGVFEQKIKIVNFGVEADIFCPGPAYAELQKKLGVENHPSVISVRSLEPIYDIPTLLKAAAIVIEKIPDARFVIGGRGSLEAELKRQAKDFGIESNVIFAGFIPHDDLPRWFRSFNAYVSTSLSDSGIAGSTAEAMACGLPPAVTDSGENDKWIENGRNGFLSPVKDHAALAENIIKILTDHKIAIEIEENARRTILERNDYKTQMRAMENLYESLRQKK
ncbi:MAG: glycosyltransferase [Minisyncoccales bacterium]